MSKKTKIWLVIATLLVVIGCIIFGGVMTMLKWDFEKLSTSKYETNEYEISESYKNIQIVTSTANVVLEATDNSQTSVVCHELEKTKHSVEVKDGTLTIKEIDSRKWYEYIGINFGVQKITVSIPKSEYEKVGIKTSTGNINVQHLSAEALDVSVTTGSITLSDVNCAGEVKNKVSTGKTNMTNITCKNFIAKGNTGNITLKNVTVEEKMSIERSTGDVKFDACDAKDICVVTDTGNVVGSLLSSKVFVTKTDTGRIEVPKTSSGGTCEISTDTGDIKITIQK